AFGVGPGATLGLESDNTAITLTGAYSGVFGGVVSLFGDFLIGAGGASFNFPAGMLNWDFGSLNQSLGNVTNLGTLALRIPVPNPSLKVIGGTLINQGTLAFIGQADLELDQGAVLNNLAGGTIDFRIEAVISSDLGPRAAVNNAGLLTKTGTTGTSRVDVPLDNTGSVEVHSGKLQLGSVTQLSTGALGGGSWSVLAAAGSSATLSITSPQAFSTINSGAKVTLSGTGADFTNFEFPLNNAGTLALQGGKDATSIGGFQNTGTLRLGSGSLLSNTRGFTQSDTGTYRVQVGGSSLSPLAGTVITGRNGAVSLAGKLVVELATIPALGRSIKIVSDGQLTPANVPVAVQGTFAGLAEGATFSVGPVKFQITYKGGDGNDVVLKVVGSPILSAPAFGRRHITPRLFAGGVATLT